MADGLKPLVWIASSRDDLRAMPKGVQDVFGYALYRAQCGDHPHNAKPLRGIGGGVIEVVEDHDRGTYRAVYTVRFEGVVYVLHVFQKKSKRGSATPRADVSLIEGRLKRAKQEYEQWRQASAPARQ